MANVGDENQVKIKKTKKALEREAELDDLKQILQTARGRYFIWRLLERCRVFNTSASMDPSVCLFQSAERNIGLWVWGELFQAYPDAYDKMREEAKEREDKSK